MMTSTLSTATAQTATAGDDGVAAFMSARPRLLSIAGRILRSAADAEDIVQDVWVRWQAADRSLVRNATAFLATTTTRLAINVMQSARSRRETNGESWLPEPVATSADPALAAERAEALKSGLMVLLTKLAPLERAAYILREAFDYSYRDIAQLLRIGEANARQVVTRARQHIAQGRRTFGGSVAQRGVLEGVIGHIMAGDISAIRDIVPGERDSMPSHPVLVSGDGMRRVDRQGRRHQSHAHAIDVDRSEPELRGELDNSRIERGRDRAEARRPELRRWRAEVRRVQQVEHFEAEFERSAPAEAHAAY